MSSYIKAALQRFNHPIPTKLQYSPFPHTPPNYSAKVKYTKEPDTTEILNQRGKKFIQRVSGTLIYLAHAVDITILNLLSSVASQQYKPTATTKNRTLQILEYVSTQEEVFLTYSRSQMTLAMHSDAV